MRHARHPSVIMRLPMETDSPQKGLAATALSGSAAIRFPRMAILLTLIGTLALAAGAAAEEGVREKSPAVVPLFQSCFDIPPNVSKASGKTVWNLWRRNFGTRSEGMHGALFINGREYFPSPGEAVVVTELGKFSWNGGIDERRRLWDSSGWLPVEREPGDFPGPDATSSLFASVVRRPPDYFLQDDDTLWKSWSFSFERQQPVEGGMDLTVTVRSVFGALRVGGRWLSGSRVGETIETGVGTFLWNGPFARDEGRFGWIPVGKDAGEADAGFIARVRNGDATAGELAKLLELGANIDATDENGATPLMWAAGFRDRLPENAAAGSEFPAPIVAFLLAGGAEVNAADNEGQTALMWAATNADNPTVIRALIDAGADLRAVDGKGRTALMHAASGAANSAAITLLLEAGAEVDAANEFDGATAFVYAACHNPDPEAARLLLRAGANPCVVFDGVQTALRAAKFRNPNPEVWRRLDALYADASPCPEPGPMGLYIDNAAIPGKKTATARNASESHPDTSDLPSPEEDGHPPERPRRLATPFIAWPPTVMLRKGDAEWHGWLPGFQVRRRKPFSKLFVDGREVDFSTNGRSVECDLGALAWHDSGSNGDGYSPASGWFWKDRRIGRYPRDVDALLEADRFTARAPDTRYGADDSLWFFWFFSVADKAGGGYGALSLNGAWLLGGEIGDTVEFFGKTMVWKGAPTAEAESGWFGWAPENSDFLLSPTSIK